MTDTIYSLHKQIHRERRRLESLVDQEGLQSDKVLLQSYNVEYLTNALLRKAGKEATNEF